MYSHQSGFGKLIPALSTAVAPAVLTSTGVKSEFACVGERMAIQRVAIAISTAVVSSGGVVITVKNRPTIASATGEATITTLTVPAGTAAGKVVYKDINEALIVPGGSLVFEVTTAAAGGGAAGGGIYGFVASEDPEYKLNESSMIASA
jgi:hypothetical protein